MRNVVVLYYFCCSQLYVHFAVFCCFCVKAEEAKVKILEVAGDRVDNKSKLEVIRQEEEIIRHEKEERKKEEEAEKLAAEAAVFASNDVILLCALWRCCLGVREGKVAYCFSSLHWTLVSLEHTLVCMCNVHYVHRYILWWPISPAERESRGKLAIPVSRVYVKGWPLNGHVCIMSL